MATQIIWHREYRIEIWPDPFGGGYFAEVFNPLGEIEASHLDMDQPEANREELIDNCRTFIDAECIPNSQS